MPRSRRNRRRNSNAATYKPNDNAPTNRTERQPQFEWRPRGRKPVPQGAREKLEESWTRYESIQLHNHEETLESIRANGHVDENVEWVVTEKIHGANFGLLTNGKHVVATKRTSLLNDDTSFFRGWQQVVDDHCHTTLKIFQHVKAKINPDAQAITIFGELFGGFYEHPEIEVPETVGQVQFGLSYSPNLHFCAFDIKIDETFLDYNVAHAICLRFRLMFAEPILRGSFDECMQFDVETFETQVPSRLNLPPPVTRHGEPNIGEGVVIRRAEGAHVMVKKKSQKFWEFSSKKRSEEAQEKREMIGLIGEEKVEFIWGCFADARFDGAVSKIGEVNAGNGPQIVAEFSQDVLKDVVEMYPDLQRMDGDIWGRVRKYIVDTAARQAKSMINRRKQQLKQQRSEADSVDEKAE